MKVGLGLIALLGIVGSMTPASATPPLSEEESTKISELLAAATAAGDAASSEKQWDQAIERYSTALELSKIANRPDIDVLRCKRGKALLLANRLTEAKADLGVAANPIEAELRRESYVPTECYVTRAQLEERLNHRTTAALFYALAFRDDGGVEAQPALERLHRCPLVALPLKGKKAADWNAVWSILRPDRPTPKDVARTLIGVGNCEGFCRIDEDAALLRPLAGGGIFVFPSVLPSQTSRCGGTKHEDQTSYFRYRFDWTSPRTTCSPGPSGQESCQEYCPDDAAAELVGWETRTVVPDPVHVDTVWVIDQRYTTNGRSAAGADEPIEVLVTGSTIAAKAPYCETIPAWPKPTSASVKRRSAVPQTLSRWFRGRLLRRFFR